ncbi:MAG: Bug family tripartite tricarboxylate transporter substrate binding protein [Lautropia sp.]
MNDRRTILKGMAAGALAGTGVAGIAQEDRSPITLLVGAASSMDFTARLLADYLREALGRPVIAVSKLGAGGRLALGELKHAAPDGRTLMLSTSSPFTIFPNIYTNLEYDPVRDFTPIAGVAWFDVGLAVAPALGIGSMKDMLAWAKRQGNDVIYGAAPGTGSASHFAGIAVEQATGLKLTPVPYKDSAKGIIDTIGGRIPLMITGTSPLAAMHQAGKLKMLATSGDERSPLVPDVPTMRESGIDASIVISASLYGPANMPPALVAKLHDTLQPLFGDKTLVERLSKQGMATKSMSGAELAASLARERERYARLAKASGYVPVPA